MAFPTTRLAIQVRIAPGADLTADPGTWSWQDITSRVRVGNGNSIVIGRGGPDEFDTLRPGSCQLVVDNTDGDFVSRNPTGQWYPDLHRGTPLQVRVDPGTGYETRFTGEISELPTRWDISGNDTVAPITASGVLRRLNQGSVLRSALYRQLAIQTYSTSPPARQYWPCEDEAGAMSFASAIAGAPPMQFSDVTPAGFSDVVGSDPLPMLGVNASMVGSVPPFTYTGQWAIRFALKIPAAVASPVYPLSWSTPGGNPDSWRFVITPGSPDNIKLQAFNAGTEVLADTGLDFTAGGGASDPELYDQQLFIAVNATQNGTQIDYEYFIRYNGSNSMSSNVTSSTLANPAQVWMIASPALENAALGHIAVADDTTYFSDITGATGFDGDFAWLRFIRLCAEEDITYDATLSGGVQMGTQQRGKLTDLLRQIADADSGLIYESLDYGLVLLQGYERYNRSVDLTLDYAAQQVAPPFEPTDDDQNVRNDVEARRIDGTRYRAISTKPGFRPIDIGSYADSPSLNLFTDEDLPFHAQWRVHLGTAEDQRYPQISLNLARSTSKIAAWLACDIGSRIQVTNPPPELPPDTIDLLLSGYTEVLGPKAWRVTANCVPARPWSVFEAEDASLGLVDTGGSQLLAAATSGATSLKVWTDTSLGPKWSTASTPYGLEIGGERVTATTVANNAATFVAAGTAAHADNASVSPGLPAGLTAGDALLVFAAIRNSGTGTVNTPAGYTPVIVFGNCALFGKIAVSGETAPAVSFTGGVAGATCSAQTAAFRNCSIEVVNSTSQLNGSAANIAYPSFGVDRPNCVVLVLGWKQDDWTSVATLGGFTEIGEPSSTTGDDQGLVWDHVIQTSAAEIASGSFSVTGGTSQISRSALVGLASDVQTFTVTRSVNTVTKAQTAGTAVSLWHPGVIAL